MKKPLMYLLYVLLTKIFFRKKGDFHYKKGRKIFLTKKRSRDFSGQKVFPKA